MASDRHPHRFRGDASLSKAQAGLAKIIAVISTIPPPLTALNSISRGGDGFGDSEEAAVVLDLNLRLGPEIDGREPADDVGGHSSLVIDPAHSAGTSNVPKVKDETISPAESVAGDGRRAEKSSEGECDPGEGEEEEIKKEEEMSEIAYVNQQQQEEEEEEGTDENSDRNKNGGGGYMDLLLEAVQQELAPAEEEHIEKEEEEDAELETKTEPSADSSRRVGAPSPSPSKRRREEGIKWAASEFNEGEAAPLVRSNRGRKQTLPSRYRDSVIEPWAKPPTVTRHRTATSPRVTGRRSSSSRRCTPTP